MKTPLEIFGALFEDLQRSKVASDDKAISDAIPLAPVNEILNTYTTLIAAKTFDPHSFFKKYFNVVLAGESGFESDLSQSVSDHVNRLWDVLQRKEDNAEEGSSLIDLRYPYIVPGGRFNEIYYWDSYFTMLGLKVSKRYSVIRSMLDNFADMIDRFGFIPNGNRSYFLTRSQPPFFSLMVELLATIDGDGIIIKFLPQLIKEHQFWMDRPADTSAKNYKHTVLLEDGAMLNRYFDEGDQPREEMYATDEEMCKESNRSSKELMADIRGACESGWDFSSRWLTNPQDLSTIVTRDIIPVDLNCLLYQLELTIAKGYLLSDNSQQNVAFTQKASQRMKAVQKYCWNSDFYYDYNTNSNQSTRVPSLAALYPLFFNIALEEQAEKCKAKLEAGFLQPGGLISTLATTGQQWDAPNGWAPLQYMTIIGLRNYGYNELADTIKKRWLTLNETVFAQTGKMLEKYNVVDINLPTGGGEYPVQDGFGWTNGVYLALKEKH